jgi:secreted trypsin-like serine protease
VRIIGGQEATASRFPYAAAIYKLTPSGNYFCTGSFMNYQWILTAGQCVDGYNNNSTQQSTLILTFQRNFIHNSFGNAQAEWR